MRTKTTLLCGTLLICGLAGAAPPASAAGTLLISEFRVRGPNGANDEFVEIYNNSGADHTVASVAGTGYSIAADDNLVRCTIPDGTVIPRNGHYLCTNSTGYSYAAYPTATGDATYATDIPDQSGIALFNNNAGGGSFTLANRFDAVGPTGEANTLYREGAGLPALTPFSIEYSWVRDTCGKGGAVNVLGACTISSPKDTDDNASDFIFVDTNGTSAGGGQRLGAPGPENLSAPISGTSSIPNTPLDSCVANLDTPNFVRDLTSVPANNSTFGTIDIRRTFTNNTGGNLTLLRFRIVDLDTFPAASGFADLRPITSADFPGVTVDRPPCGSGTSNITVFGTTLEQDNTAPSTGQPNGGGFNSSMGAGTVTLGTPLANGASIDLRFLFGIQQTGNFRVSFIIEALPLGGGATDTFFVTGNTDGPVVSSSVRANPSPTAATSVNYTVTFSQSVTGVDTSDFALTTTGAVAGASVTGVSGSGTTYTVTVNTGTGNGTIRLDVVDDDSIVNGTPAPLGGTGAGNGNFTTGEVYTVDKTAPVVSSSVRVNPNPTAAATVDYTVTFSQSVTGVNVADFALTTTGVSGAAVTNVAGSGTTYTVTVNTGTGNGTIRLDVVDDDSIINGTAVPLGGAGAGNGNFTTGAVYNVNKGDGGFGGALSPWLLVWGLALGLFRPLLRRAASA